MPRVLSDDLFARLEEGDRRAAARLITLIESDRGAAAEIVKRIHARTGRAHVIGITGPPGAGKSTLVDVIIDTLREEGKTIGVIAVDPSSPFTGGAILGDRIRMKRRSTDPEVFIRSMGSRGHLGGLSGATADAVKVLDAMGKDVILVETVGVGQGEVEIMELADTVAIVLVPGMGDDIQSIKAGVLEIGDVFVVNKADRDGAERTVAEIEMNLMMGLGKEDARAETMDAEETHHERDPARQRADGFLEEDRVHEAERRRAPPRKQVGTAARKRTDGDEASEDPLAEDPDRVRFFEELLSAGKWYPPVVRTIAESGAGVDRLIDYLARHDTWITETGRREERLAKRAEQELLAHVKELVLAPLAHPDALGETFRTLARRVAERETDPHSAAKRLLALLGAEHHPDAG